MPKHNDLENRALQIVKNKGSEGILQSDLWRELGANSRDGSRISLRLERKNLVKRKREMSNGRWTYRILIKRTPLEIDSILDTPCVSCQDISKCETGGEISSVICKNMTNWLLTLTENKKNITPK